jgi:3-hydroxyacyl-[acyl-carrier-protein] dehydratase
MLLVDHVLSYDQDHIVCSKAFRADEFFLQGHFPGDPIVPGVILCECALQAGAVLLAQRHAGRAGVPLATRLDQVRFRRVVRPGETIEIDVHLRDHVSQAYYLDARIRCGGQVAARLEFACTLAPHTEKDSSGLASATGSGCDDR